MGYYMATWALRNEKTGTVTAIRSIECLDSDTEEGALKEINLKYELSNWKPVNIKFHFDKDVE